MKIIECPRDAMQGIKTFIPTSEKVSYLQSLLDCNFDTLDLGSFVSPKAIPQMADTAQVLTDLDFSKTKTKALVIVANTRGAKQAVTFPKVTYLGYPFSISEIFQMRNTRKTIVESLETLSEILELAQTHQKKVITYLSMGFGNPYGEPWNPKIVEKWVAKLVTMGVRTISLSDTVGLAKLEDISSLLTHLIPMYPHVEFGVHLHTNPNQATQKIEVAYEAGCRRFDGAISGFGGCPMALDALTGNMPTEQVIEYLDKKGILEQLSGFSTVAFQKSYKEALTLFEKYTTTSS